LVHESRPDSIVADEPKAAEPQFQRAIGVVYTPRRNAALGA
jgi:hypothetical protein